MTITCTKPGFYRTRDGRKAMAGPNQNDNRLIGFIFDHTDFPSVQTWNQDGRLHTYDCHEDLITEWKEPKKVEGYVVKFNDGSYGRVLYPTRGEALLLGEPVYVSN